MISPRFWSGLVLGVSLATARLPASSQIPITPEAEAELASLVCVGEVVGSESFEAADGRILTRTVVRVSETLKGASPEFVQVVSEGGVVRGRGRSDGFSARFIRDKSYLLHLTVNTDGTLTPLNGQASARLMERASAFTKRFADRHESTLNSLRSKGKGKPMRGHDASSQAASEELKTRVAQTGSTGFSSAESTVAGGGSGLTDETGAPHRFINFEQGQPIRVLVDMQTLPPGISPLQATTAVQNALNAWSAAARVTFVIEGTQDFGKSVKSIDLPDQRLRIQLHDSFNAISNANTTLGEGGSIFFNTKPGLGGAIKGKNFDRISSGFVLIDHAKASLANDPKVFEEVLCHEIGHALGLDHSSNNAAEPNSSFAGAIMYFRVLDNGRGATLSTYDINKIREVYPVDDSPPYAPDRVINVVTGANATGAAALNAIAGVNEVNLSGFDRETASNSLTATLVSQESVTGSDFSLNGTRLKYSVSASVGVSGELITDPNTFYDIAYVRLSDGVNSSPLIQVRTVSFSRDTKPSNNAPDGLPDAWAQTNLGSTSTLGSADTDGDGQTNLQEFFLGTNPLSANSKLRPTLVDAKTLKWIGSGFAAYRIERATSLISPVWTPVGFSVPATEFEAIFTLPAPVGANEFYRVVALP